MKYILNKIKISNKINIIMKQTLVIISGNIGSGKSTILKKCNDYIII